MSALFGRGGLPRWTRRPPGRLELINSSPLTKHKPLVDWLKADYGIGHGHATALVGYALAQRAAGGTEGPP